MSEGLIGFLGVGPQRTGTSWLDRTLRKDGRVSLPQDVKETFFFDQHFSRGWGWYQRLYRGTDRTKLRGELAPTYFSSGAARERIARLRPNPKIIVTLRDPVERTISLYHHHLTKGDLSQEGLPDAANKIPSLLEASRYSRHLPAWRRALPSAPILVLFQEELDVDPQSVWNRLCRFLELDERALSKNDRQRYGVATVPRYPVLARTAAATARRMRLLGLHRIVETGKALGLKRVFAGGRERPPLPEKDVSWLQEQLGSEQRWMQELRGRVDASDGRLP